VRGHEGPSNDELASELERLRGEIDEVRRERDELRTGKERLANILRASTDALFEVELPSLALHWSPSAGDLGGRAAHEAFADVDAWIAAVHPLDQERIAREPGEVLMSGVPRWEGEYRLRRRDGSYAWVTGRAVLVCDAAGRPTAIVGAVRDTTERRRADDERERLLGELRHAVRARDEFLSIASHELRTPLTTLKLQIEGLRRLSERDEHADPARGRRIAMALQQANRLERLVNGLLDVSRIAAGRLELEPEDVDLGALVEDVVERLRDGAARVGCTLACKVDGAVVGRWDALRLEQVLTNLLSNAMKYGPNGPIAIRVERADGVARLCVSDAGIGIAPEDHPRIFGRYERAASDRNYGGLGLGLYIARQIVEAMGGRIGVESERGHGATFTVELPTG
jgi:PAS domain S-box-containing protein